MAQLGIVSIFARDCLVPRRGGSATGQELFDLYLDWCSRHGRVALRNGHFREDMQIFWHVRWACWSSGMAETLCSWMWRPV